MDYNKEQKKIVEEVKKNCVSTKGGGKRDGDVCCGIIKSHIENYIPLTKKVIGPHIFIKDIPNELDLIVINKEAKPDDFVNSFNIDDVDLVLEIKKNGPRPAKNKPHPLVKTRILFDKIKGKKSEVTGQILRDIRLMIEQSRHRFSQMINTELVVLYWNIGKRIQQDILKEKRAAYGEAIVQTLSAFCV